MGRRRRLLPNTPEISERVRANIGLAHRAAKDAWGTGHAGVCYEDVLSDACYALWRAAVDWDEARGASFATLGYLSCFRAACGRIHGERVRKNTIRAIRLEPHRSDPRQGADGVVGGLIDEEERGELVEWVRGELARLGERKAAILQAWLLGGRTLKEIGIEMGLSRPRVQAICANARREIMERFAGRQRRSRLAA